MTTLNELYEQIGEMLEQEGFDGDRDVLGIHQPTYPIQEVISGVIDPEAQNEKCMVPGSETCIMCEERMGPDLRSVEGWAMVDGNEDFEGYAHDKCKKEHDDESGSSPVYLVLGGSPSNRSPYGPNVWGMM